MSGQAWPGQEVTQRAPGSLGGSGFIYRPPPDPYRAAADARANRSEARADRADARAAEAARRAQEKADREDTIVPAPGNAALTGEDYLKTLPPALAGQVKALSDGRRAYPTGAALRSPAIQQLLAAATQYDPTLDAANAATRVATRKKFTSGTTRDNITAINTALGHLGSLYKDAQALNNFGSPLINAPVNAIESGVFGDPRLKTFNETRHAVVDELEKAFRGSGGTQTGIEEWKSNISSSDSPDQLRHTISKAVELLSSRLESLNQAYTDGMGKSADPMQFLNPHAQAVFNALGPNGDGNVPDLPKDFGGTPPILGNGGSGPSPPPEAPPGPPRIGSADYSGMVGGPNASLATTDPNSAAGAFKQTYRNEYDPTMAGAISAFIRKGAPYDTVATYAQSHGFVPPQPHDYAAAVTFAKEHHGATNVESNRLVPTTLGERLSSSPAAALVAGAGSAATAGFNDRLGRAIDGNEYDANRAALAATNPGPDAVGNVLGGAAGAFGGNALLSRFAPGALALGGRVLGRFAPAAGDAAYSGIYAANENPDDPWAGLKGAGLGVLAGAAGRAGTRGLANVISPPAGAFGPVYDAGIFPTLGQRFAKSGVAGRAINTAEQAMQSVPGLGALVARARDIPREGAQLGAFNQSLGELKPFDSILGETISQLPPNTQPGTAPHVFAKDAFDRAYQLARSGMQFKPDAQYLTDTQALGGQIGNGILRPDQVQQVRSVIDNAVVGRLKNAGGVLNGDAYKQASSDIGKAIQTWGRDGSTQPMAQALSDYQAIFDSAARRSSHPDAVNLLDAADRGYAKYAIVRNAGARVGGDPGTFTMKNLSRAVQQEGGGVKSAPYQRGQALMQDYATAVQPLGDTLANSGTGERLMTNRMFMGEQGGAGALAYGSGLGGAALAHPGSLAPFALYAPGVNKLVTRAIAPRSATLPPEAAAVLENLALKVNNAAPVVGRASVPGALAYYGLGL